MLLEKDGVKSGYCLKDLLKSFMQFSGMTRYYRCGDALFTIWLMLKLYIIFAPFVVCRSYLDEF